jgi:hypothetical protein
MGSFSPFISMYSLMFSFLQPSFQGFLQCSMFPTYRMPLFVFSAFKAVAETTGWSRGGVSESETLNVYSDDLKIDYLRCYCIPCYL